MSYLYGPAHWTLDFLFRSVVMVLLSYGVAIVGALCINALRVPWLLDAESGEQIDALETRVLHAEREVADAAATNRRNAELHDLFGALMEEGEALAQTLKETHGNEFPAWAQKRRVWIEGVNQTLVQMGFSTEAAAFRQAGEIEPIPAPGTIMDDRYYYRLYNEQLTGSRNELKDIVRRRLP